MKEFCSLSIFPVEWNQSKSCMGVSQQGKYCGSKLWQRIESELSLTTLMYPTISSSWNSSVGRALNDFPWVRYPATYTGKRSSVAQCSTKCFKKKVLECTCKKNVLERDMECEFCKVTFLYN